VLALIGQTEPLEVTTGSGVRVTVPPIMVVLNGRTGS
jgi:hypothetical protein